MAPLGMVFFLLPWLPGPAPATLATPAEPAFHEPAAVLLNLSEQSLNRIVVDSFRANGGPRVEGERARVSSRVGDLRYHASLSEPVLQLGDDQTARLWLDVLDANLRIGRLERRGGGSGARCEGAGIDVDPTRPLRVDLAVDLAIENQVLRVIPRSVEIPEVADRLQLVGPTRCTNSLVPTRLLWWLGRPFVRRSVNDLDRILLERARRSAARLEDREELVRAGWGSDLHLYPGALDTRGGSLLVTLAASTAGPEVGGGERVPGARDASSPDLPGNAPRRGAGPSREALPAGSFLGISESLVNEVARRLLAREPRFRVLSTDDARRLLANDAIQALVPGLRTVGSRERLEVEVVFREPPRVEFRSVGDDASVPQGSPALVRVLVSGVDLEIRRNDAGRTTWLGTLHVESGWIGLVPYANLLGGVSFRIVENRWRTSSTGIEFDDELAAATLQEVAFGKVFETSYAPLSARELRIGDTEFEPRSFAALDGYLVIGLGEREAPQTEGLELAPRSRAERSPGAATRTGTLLESR